MSSATQVAAELAALGASITPKVHEATKLWTAELQAQVQRNASGRPGPNAPTGNYRRSINRRVEKAKTGSTGQVGTNAVQAARLEYGFVGIDSLGRSYNQPPYPHFGPALDKIGPLYQAAIAAVATPLGTGGNVGNVRGVLGRLL